MRFLPLFALFFFKTSSLFSLTLFPSTPLTLSSSGNNALPQVAVNPTGNAIAIWTKTSSNQIETAFFNRTTLTWSAPIIIGSGGAPQVGIDNDGNGIAVWVNVNQIQTARFFFTSKVWSLPIFITSIGFNIAPQLSVGSTGHAIAVWLSSASGVATQIQGSVFDVATSTWSNPVVISNQGGTTPDVGTDKDGNGIVVWQNLNNASILTSFLRKG